MLRLAPPVPHERRRADDEHGTFSERLDQGECLHGLAEAHFVGNEAAAARASTLEQPERAFDLIRPELFAKRAEVGRHELRSRRRGAAFPLRDARFQVTAKLRRDAVAAAFLARIAIAQDFLEVGGERGIGDRDFSALQFQMRLAALEQAGEVGVREQGLAAAVW